MEHIKEPAVGHIRQAGFKSDSSTNNFNRETINYKEPEQFNSLDEFSTNNQDALRDKVIHRQTSKPGLRGKVNAMCCYCIYDPYSNGTWRLQVENCTSYKCPIWPVRPKASYGHE